MRHAIFLGLILVSSFAIAQPLKIEIFTTHNYPIYVMKSTNYRVDYYNIDDAGALFNLLNNAAKNQKGKQAFYSHQEALQQAYKGLTLILQYGISYVPAIVFDQKIVFQGSSDLVSAIQRYQTWLKK